MRKIVLLLFLLIPSIVYADVEESINNKCQITLNGANQNILLDGNYATYQDYNQDNVLTITCEEEISYVYIYYNVNKIKGSVTAGENTYEVGNYLHDLVKLDQKTNSVTLTFIENFSLADIYLFNDMLPAWVETWSKLDSAEMMLFTTHADDEQLFFAGLLPTYVDKGKKIQVVYFTNHYNNTNRYHELLEGLWAVGIKYYPEVSTFPDEYSESLEEALAHLNNAGYSEEDCLKFQVEMLRKYKPNVVVGHDEAGEYSHGQHILDTYVLEKAIYNAADESYDEESLDKYGIHQINKLYLHLYQQNPIVLDLDVPLASFNGLTAYEVSKGGYAKHYSQQYTWFTEWLNGPNNSYTKASEITKYSPQEYGLYFTNVGEDINKNDMFENVPTKMPNEKPAEPPVEEPTPEEKQEKKVKNKDKKTTILGCSLIVISSIGIIIIVLKEGRK